MSRPLLIGHRGASGDRPEHTLESYRLAIAQGADYIEPDLVATRDGVLVARHENEIGGTTDVAAHPAYAARRRTQQVDGVDVTGWFTEDFTLAELKTLRARERLPALRPASAAFDGRFDVPTFDEILALLRDVNPRRAAAGLPQIGVCPETKHPSHFAAIGLPLEPLLAAALRAGPAPAPVLIQSFETGNLRRLRRLGDWPLLHLCNATGGPWDLRDAPGPREWREWLLPEPLARIREFADVLGLHKDLVIPRDANDRLGDPSRVVDDAHAAGLQVHAWTFRAENAFLPAELRGGGGDAAHGDLSAEIARYLGAGIDGLFADQPAAARRAIDDFTATRRG